jgi:hypothetical protein
MRWLVLLVVLLAAPAQAVDWYADTDFAYRQKITIDNTKVGADLTDFPIYVNTDDLASGFYTNAQADCDDVRITKSDGTTEVPREIVFCDGTNGELHFKASGTLSGSSDTDFYIYYGNASASDYATSATYGAENVWSDYIAVYHFQEDPSGTAPQLLDSTSASQDGTSQGSMTSGDLVAGKLSGYAYDFDGSNDRVVVSNTTALQLLGSYTISGWTLSNITAGLSLVEKVNTPLPPTQGWNMILTGGTTDVYRIAGYNSGIQVTADGTTDVNDNTNWYQFHAVQDGSTRADMYTNGTQEGADTSVSTNGAATTNMYIGGRGNGVNSYTLMKFDELRFRATNLSANRISTEYNNQNSSSTFYTASAEETAPAGSASSLGFGFNF